jgi:thiol-disulfide isomerase/thioredoxin
MAARAPHPAAFVFIQDGCPACHDFMPKLQQAADGFPHPLGVYDVSKGGHETEFGNRLRVRATPTTIVMDSAGRMHRFEGTTGVREIRALLGRAR